jgi:hypothetical protein
VAICHWSKTSCEIANTAWLTDWLQPQELRAE